MSRPVGASEFYEPFASGFKSAASPAIKGAPAASWIHVLVFDPQRFLTLTPFRSPLSTISDFTLSPASGKTTHAWNDRMEPSCGSWRQDRLSFSSLPSYLPSLALFRDESMLLYCLGLMRLGSYHRMVSNGDEGGGLCELIIAWVLVKQHWIEQKQRAVRRVEFCAARRTKNYFSQTGTIFF